VSNSSNCSGKRSADEDVHVDMKKIKIETPTLEQQASIFRAGNIVQPKFVSAAKMVVPILEMTDEELLTSALEFDRQNGI
jgi:hypothetical protein